MSSAAASAVARLPKPKLRGHLQEELKRALISSALYAVAGGLAYKYGVAEPRKKRYAEFYRSVSPSLACELTPALLPSAGQHL